MQLELEDGIREKIHYFLTSNLTNHIQTVVVDGHKSNRSPVISGVPLYFPTLLIQLAVALQRHKALKINQKFIRCNTITK